jgi:hypothetical protein
VFGDKFALSFQTEPIAILLMSGTGLAAYPGYQVVVRFEIGIRAVHPVRTLGESAYATEEQDHANCNSTLNNSHGLPWSTFPDRMLEQA